MIQQAYVLSVAVTAMLFAGCSAWDGGYRGGGPPSAQDMEGKTIMGVYRDLDTNGSIPPHPVMVGTGGRITSAIKAGGSALELDSRTGEMVIKGGTNKPSSGSPQDNSGSSAGTNGDRR